MGKKNDRTPFDGVAKKIIESLKLKMYIDGSRKQNILHINGKSPYVNPPEWLYPDDLHDIEEIQDAMRESVSIHEVRLVARRIHEILSKDMEPWVEEVPDQNR